jgi:hypothetical protein
LIPVKIPVQASLSYDDFQRITSLEKQSRNLDVSSTHLQSMGRIYLSNTSASAYVDCLKLTNKYVEVVAPPSALRPDADEFIVTITWFEKGGPQERKFDAYPDGSVFRVVHGQLLERAPSTIRNGGSRQIRVKRDKNKDFSFATAVDGEPGQLDIPRAGTTSTVKYDVATSPPITSVTGHDNGYADVQKTICLEAKSNEVYFASTAHAVDDFWSGQDRIRVNSWLLGVEPPKSFKTTCGGPGVVNPSDGGATANEKLVCVRNCSHVSRKGIGATITSRVKVIRATWANN